MNRYLCFNSDGTLYQQMTAPSAPQGDGKQYVDESLLSFTPNIFKNSYVLADGVVLASEVEEEISDENPFEALRSHRDHLLNASDWTQLPNGPLTDTKKQEWATYRQELRDLPDDTTDPLNVTWPTPPN